MSNYTQLLEDELKKRSEENVTESLDLGECLTKMQKLSEGRMKASKEQQDFIIGLLKNNNKINKI